MSYPEDAPELGTRVEEGIHIVAKEFSELGNLGLSGYLEERRARALTVALRFVTDHPHSGATLAANLSEK